MNHSLSDLQVNTDNVQFYCGGELSLKKRAISRTADTGGKVRKGLGSKNINTGVVGNLSHLENSFHLHITRTATCMNNFPVRRIFHYTGLLSGHVGFAGYYRPITAMWL